MEDLLISLSICLITGFCMFIFVDYDKEKNWRMVIIRTVFVISAVALCFKPVSFFPVCFFPYIFRILISFFLSVMGTCLIYFIFAIIAWIFGITVSDITNKIAGKKEKEY